MVVKRLAAVLWSCVVDIGGNLETAVKLCGQGILERLAGRVVGRSILQLQRQRIKVAESLVIPSCVGVTTGVTVCATFYRLRDELTTVSGLFDLIARPAQAGDIFWLVALVFEVISRVLWYIVIA